MRVGCRSELGTKGLAARRITTKPSEVHDTTASSSIGRTGGCTRSRPECWLRRVGTESLEDSAVAGSSKTDSGVLLLVLVPELEFESSSGILAALRKGVRRPDETPEEALLAM